MRRVLWLLSLLVPPPLRPRWREEWLAELGQINCTKGKLAAYRIFMGALPDACEVRRIDSLAKQPRRGRPFHGIGDDLRHSLRSLFKSPSFALCVVGSLTLGIAATITTFTFLNALLFRPFPGVRNQHELVRIEPTRQVNGHTTYTSTLNDYRVFRDGLTTLSGLAAYTSDVVAVAIDGRAVSLRAAMVTENYFDVFGVRPALGRPFATPPTADEGDGVVIAHSLWIREFGGRPTVLGTFVGLGAAGNARIIGVTPPDFVGVSRSDVGILDRGVEMWLPVPLARRVFPPVSRLFVDGSEDDLRSFKFTGRRRRDVTERDVQAEATLVASRLAEERPADRAGAAARVSRLWFDDYRPGMMMTMFFSFLSVPAVVLLIACLNAANLLLARGSRRAREMAVRLALGATRWRIVRQLLVESVLLSLLAAAASLPIGLWAISFVRVYINLPMPVDERVVAFAAAVALLSAVASSLAPALRLSAASPGAALGSSRSGDEEPRRGRARRILVVCQVALSLGLLATGGQLTTFLPGQAPSTGTPSDKLLMSSFDVSQVRMNPDESDAFYRRLLERVSTLPEADGAGLARRNAVWTFGRGLASSAVAVRRPGDAPSDGVVAIGGYAGGDLFRALGLRVIQGRGFIREDRGTVPRVAVVNQPLADAFFGGAAVGRTIYVRAWPPVKKGVTPLEVTIVGVIDAAHEPSYRREPNPAAYLPVPLLEEPKLTLYVRANGSPKALASRIREAATEVDSRVPPIEIRTLQEITEHRQFPERLSAKGVSLLGLVGLLLATGGLYGVMSYLVTLRSREIGVRLALGADPASVLRMTLGEAMRLAAWGAVIGGVLAVVTSKIVQSQMHGVRGLNLTYLAGSFLLLAATMLLASAIPARRAARVDPITALRQE